MAMDLMMPRPYTPDELTDLERMMSQLQSSSVTPAPAAAPAATLPAPAPAPVAAVAPPPPEAPVPQAQPEPAAPSPLDLAMPKVTPGKGMIRQSVATEQNPWADSLLAANKQLADQQMGTLTRQSDAESEILGKRTQRLEGQRDRFASQEEALGRSRAAQQDANAKLRAEGADWAARKDQPEKAFEGRRWAQALLAIGMAAGTYSQAMGWQNGNPVREQFERIINDEVESQREQKASMLANIAQRLGDGKAAEDLLTAQLNDAIANKLEAEFQLATNEEERARLQPLIQERRDKVQAGVVAAYERLAPKQQTTDVRAAGKGGPPSLQQQLAEQEAGQKLRQGKVSAAMEAGLSRDEAEDLIDKRFPSLATFRGKTTDQRTAAEKADAEAAKTKEQRDYEQATREDSADQAKAKGALDGANALAAEMGLVRDPNTGEWREGEDARNPLLVAAKELVPFSSQKVSKLKKAAVEGFGRLESGGVIGGEELKNFEEMVTGATTAEQLAESMNAIEVIIRPRLSRRSNQPTAAPSNWK